MTVPAELTQKADWPWYPEDRPLTFLDAPVLAEEYKQRWIGCMADKDEIAALSGEQSDD